MQHRNDFFALRNGVRIPCIGYGTYQIPQDAHISAVIHQAISTGYRFFDTASFYGNEQGIGQGLRTCGVPREQLFVATKVWPSEMGYDATLQAFERSLGKLGLDYLDAYLIHWPVPKEHLQDWRQVVRETWKAMERLYEEKALRVLGVSNFLPHHLEALLPYANVAPAINQLEIHPGNPNEAAISYCRQNGIQPEAWRPLLKGRLLQDPILLRIAQKHGATPAQVCLRWCLQQDILPIVKTVTPQRMAENMDIFDFILDADDFRAMEKLSCYGKTGADPDKGM